MFMIKTTKKEVSKYGNDQMALEFIQEKGSGLRISPSTKPKGNRSLLLIPFLFLEWLN